MALLIECLAGIILFTIIILVAFPIAIKNPEYIAGDYPPAVLEKCIELGIITKREKRLSKGEIIKKLVALVLFVVLLAFIVNKFNGAQSFLDVFINSYIIWFVVTWYDALVIDCIFFCNVKRFRIPGTEDMKEYKDYWFHIKGSIRGSLIGIPACMLVGLFVLIF